MGTDVEVIAQKQVNNQWVDIDISWDVSRRSYYLFTVLAGVRRRAHLNDLPQIAPVRGIPSNIGDYDIDDIKNLGIVITWLTSTEILEFFNNHPDIGKEVCWFSTMINFEHAKHGEFRLIIGFD